MTIAIIGTGHVGAALGRGWAAAGHAVTFGSQRPAAADVQALAAAAGARADTPGAAVRAAHVVVLATPWSAAQDAVAGLGDLTGRTVVDATNPIGSGLSLLGPPSGGEMVAGWAAGACVVKAFNTTGWENLADGRTAAGPLAMFLAGDDADAKAVVAGLAADLGFEPIDAGPLVRAAWLEALALLWITQAGAAGRGFGFALLRR